MRAVNWDVKVVGECEGTEGVMVQLK